MTEPTPRESRAPLAARQAARLCAGLRVLVPLSALLWSVTSAGLTQAEQPLFRRLMREGQRLTAVGNARAASAKYNAAIEAAADDQELAEALVSHAGAQRSLDRDDQAEADLRRAIALEGAGTLRRTGMFQLASLLEEQDRLEEAIALYREVAAKLRDKPDEAADALLAAARLLADDGRFPEAREVLEELPSEALPVHPRAETASLRLDVAIGLGDLEAAKAAIRASEVEPAQRVVLYVRLARVLLDQDRAEEARKVSEMALETDPSNETAWRVQYDVAAALGTVDQLRAETAAKLGAKPEDEVLLQRMATYAEWGDDPDEALGIFSRLVKLRPNDTALLERAGSLAAGTGRNQQALEFYGAALKLQPDDSGLCYMLGEVHAKMGDRAGAVELLKKGSQFRPGDLESSRRLGTVLIRNSLYDEAVALYADTRRSLGDPDALAYEMAQALAPLRPQEALAEYVRAASVSLQDADSLAPASIKLARETNLLPQLTALTEAGLQARPAPGLVLLLTMAEAAQGKAGPAVERTIKLDLGPQDLMLIGEALESEGDRDAASRLYAAVAANPAAAPGVRVELGLRAAEGYVAGGRPEQAQLLLRSVLKDASGPRPLVERASFLLADLDLASGADLAAARATFTALAQRSSQAELSRKAQWRLADCVFAAGDFEQAEKLYGGLAAQAPEVEVESPPLPPGLDVRHPRMRMLPFAVPDEAPPPDPRTTPAYAASQVAECAFRRGDLERAKALFAEVAEKYPDSVYANDAVERRLFISTHFSNPRPATEAYLTALAAGSTDRWEEALEQLRGVAEMGLAEPLADDATLLIGALLEAHGKRAEAAETFRALPATFPGSLLGPEALLNAARLARALGDEAQAKEDLDNLLRNFPTAPMAKTAALWLDDLEQGRPWPVP